MKECIASLVYRELVVVVFYTTPKILLYMFIFPRPHFTDLNHISFSG